MVRERPFKADVKAVREALPVSRGDREHLRRWEDDHRAQQIWDEFKALNPATSPKEFIARNLDVRRYAEALSARISDSKNWHKEWSRHFAHVGATEIFAPDRAFTDQMASLRILCRDATFALSLHKNLLPPKFLIPRQNKTQKREHKGQENKNWRAHRIFIVVFSNFWHAQCGRWRDAEVAALTDIAFDAEIAAHQVRSVRRQHQATTGELRLFFTG